MKDYLINLVQNATSIPSARNAVREYLQARIMERLQRSGAFAGLAFQGGTALRFLFSLPRFSEDLDFALERPEAGYHLRRWLTDIRSGLEREGYNITLKVSDHRTVHSAFVGFPGLLFDMGLSRRRAESMSVKLEIDTRPPKGAVLAVTPVRRHVLLRIQHHDRASLFAGKLHALLARPYAKGRDLFDLAWYLSDPEWPEPNLSLLRNALEQTEGEATGMKAENWRSLLLDRLGTFEWSRLVADVRPFLEDPDLSGFLSREDLETLLKSKVQTPKAKI